MNNFQFHCTSTNLRDAILDEADRCGWAVDFNDRSSDLWVAYHDGRLGAVSDPCLGVGLAIPVGKALDRILAGPLTPEPKPEWHWPAPTQSDIGKPVWARARPSDIMFGFRHLGKLVAIFDGYCWAAEKGAKLAHAFPFCVLPDPNDPDMRPPTDLEWPRPETAEASGGV